MISNYIYLSYGVTFDLDQLHLLNENPEEIEQALSLTDQERFLGYVLQLGKIWYLTVENDDRTVSFSFERRYH